MSEGSRSTFSAFGTRDGRGEAARPATGDRAPDAQLSPPYTQQAHVPQPCPLCVHSPRRQSESKLQRPFRGGLLDYFDRFLSNHGKFQKRTLPAVFVSNESAGKWKETRRERGSPRLSSPSPIPLALPDVASFFQPPLPRDWLTGRGIEAGEMGADRLGASGHPFPFPFSSLCMRRETG